MTAERPQAAAPALGVPALGDQERTIRSTVELRHPMASAKSRPGRERLVAQVEQRAPDEERDRPDEVGGLGGGHEGDGRGEEGECHEVAVGVAEAADDPGDADDGGAGAPAVAGLMAKCPTGSRSATIVSNTGTPGVREGK